MKTVKEDKEIVGTLHTSFGAFDLLSLSPNKHNVPWYFKDSNIWSFYVVYAGVAKNIVVSGEFMIVPSAIPEVVPVTFFVEDGVSVETNTLAVESD